MNYDPRGDVTERGCHEADCNEADCHEASPDEARDDGQVRGDGRVREDDRHSQRVTATGAAIATAIEAGRGSAPVRTVDLFDTVVLRYPVCGRERDRRAAALFAGAPDAAALAAFRGEATAALHRARPMAGRGDVDFHTIAQLTLEAAGCLGDRSEVDRFRRAEIAMESDVLSPNRALLAELAEARAAKTRVIGISDTPHRAADLWTLLEKVLGEAPPLDALHTSADWDATKRDGDLFARIANCEGFSPTGVPHLGDDGRADGTSARAAGFSPTVAPRARTHHWRRRASAILWRMRLGRSRNAAGPRDRSVRSMAGPVVADAIRRLWLQLRAFELMSHGLGSGKGANGDVPVILFCARGGLVMRALLERFLERTERTLTLPRRDLMVSRIVACRAALVKGSIAAEEECEREFRGETLGAALDALGWSAGRSEEGPADIDLAAPFDVATLRRLLDDPADTALRATLREQAALFERHLRKQLGGARRAVLVDTGLYGSTLRLLEDAFPDIEWCCVLLARANYKGLDREHFARTIGLWCERDVSAPHDARSVVLRYWQWVEDLFEPDLPSVREFSDDGCTLDRGAPHWRETLLRDPKSALAAALARIDRLDPDALRTLPDEAGAAWRSLRRAIAFPCARRAGEMAVEVRSRDFGLDGSVSAFASDGTLAALRRARWKEGALAQRLPRLRLLGQLMIETLHILRWARSSVARR